MKIDSDTVRRLNNGSIDISYYVARAHQIRSNDAHRNARRFSALISTASSKTTRYFKEKYEFVNVARIFHKSDFRDCIPILRRC